MGRLEDIAKRNQAHMPRGVYRHLSTKQTKWLLIGCAVVIGLTAIGMVIQGYGQKRAEERERSVMPAEPDNSCEELGWAIDRLDVALAGVHELPGDTAIDAYCAKLRPAVVTASGRAGDRAMMREVVRKLEHFAKACESITVADSQQALANQLAEARKRVAGICAK